MNKDASTNTESLNVNVYIDNDGRIKWKLDDVLLSNKKEENINRFVEISQFSNLETHIINRLFNTAFLINCFNNYDDIFFEDINYSNEKVKDFLKLNSWSNQILNFL